MWNDDVKILLLSENFAKVNLEIKLKLVSAIFKGQMYFFIISNEVHWKEI